MPEWIPRKIMADIQGAIEATDRSTHVFYITSRGGEGKTILLRQIGMALGSPDGIAPHLPWSGILDLYHSDVNTNSGLEAHLCRALETLGEFQRYRDERDAWAARREAGLFGYELEAERVGMAEVFAECMNVVTCGNRVVVALDTTERIQYEVDKVQMHCGLQDESTTVRAWLVDQLRRWQNCVVLLVGRPEADPYLGKALAEALAADPGVHYQARELGGFDRDEARAYFAQNEREFPVLRELDPEFRDRLWEVTEGRPIRLDLAVEVVRHGLGLGKLKEKLEHGPAAKARAEIDRLLVDLVMGGESDDPVCQVLRYLAIARKGLDAELLHHLAGEWAPARCQKHLDAVAERSFVKRYPQDDRLFLHDEMYQFCDRYLLRADEVQRQSRRIVEWYDGQIAAADGQARRDLAVDSVLYRLRADPEKGYHWYVKQAESAIRAVEVGFDLRLRNEVVGFLRSTSLIDQQLLQNAPGLADEFNGDAAAGWVKRLMVRGENARAVQVADEVWAAQREFFPSDAPEFRLARADLGVYHAQALIYAGKASQSVGLLRQVIAELEGGQKPEQLARQDVETFFGWRRNLVLGRGHNNLGYAHWMYLGQYSAALAAFRAALPYYRAADLREELANTNDNMGRVYALFRTSPQAEMLVEEGLALRRKLGRDYRIALSFISRAIVHLEFGEPHRAQKIGEEALRMLEGLESPRGTGLAFIVLGRVLRQLGELWGQDLYSFQDCDRFLSDGAQYLDEAVKIFTHTVDEPVRLVEALSQLGCIYRERARLAQGVRPESPLAKTISLEAVRHLEQAVELAKDLEWPVWYADSCQDLAQVYFLRRDVEGAGVWLQRAEASVPQEYKIKKEGEPEVEIPQEERVEAFWLQMGKVEMLKAGLVFDRATGGGATPATEEALAETAEHYLLSAAYFERFSKGAIRPAKTFRQMYDRFKNCTPEQLRYLQEEALPSIVEKYALDLSRATQFFADTLGLTIESQP